MRLRHTFTTGDTHPRILLGTDTARAVAAAAADNENLDTRYERTRSLLLIESMRLVTIGR